MMLHTIISVVLLASCALGAPETLSYIRDISGLDGRIIGGEDATIEEFPYQVSLRILGSHSCGGVIISSDYVLTAAHCAGYPSSWYSIRAGSTYQTSGGVTVSVSAITAHPDYNTEIENDIAVVRLASSLTFSASIAPIPMASVNPSAGENAVVTGWGDVVEGAQTGVNVLQAVTVPIVDHEECARLYENHRYSVLPSMICAGFLEGGRDACQGDSGGPLAANGVLVGIVSWGEGCAQPNYPGVYASVAYLRSFVTEISGVQ
uniref:Serine protease-like protein n=1 Tax=Holotrichia oblita TaxID=644536 RepID=A0A977XUS5_HOLOL|nr:serine protease-like protein [Holotrichia oblita]